MLGLFKNRGADVKVVRSRLLEFIKEKLQAFTGGEGGSIMGIQLFIFCNEDERHIYESAVYYANPDKFRNDDVQRILDDYSIRLPANWRLEILFKHDYPAQAFVAPNVMSALVFQTKNSTSARNTQPACIRILSGPAALEYYSLQPAASRVNIGRETQVQTTSGFIRKNDIAFTNAEVNKPVSRQHAHIEWNAATGSFEIFADEGGIPPHNKTKVRTVTGVAIKLQAIEIGHSLAEGDQIILGDKAVLEFSYRGVQ